MAIILKPCVDEDMDQVFDLLSSAFGPNDPYMATVYPNHEDLAKRAHRGKRMLATERGRAKSTYIKAIDEETGDIVGMAKWLVAVNVLMEAERLEGDFWADEDSKELARFVSTSVRHLRYKRLMERQGYLVRSSLKSLLEADHQAALEILCVDPRYQRQGIGDSLVRWGLEIADANGLEVGDTKAAHFQV